MHAGHENIMLLFTGLASATLWKSRLLYGDEGDEITLSVVAYVVLLCAVLMDVSAFNRHWSFTK